MVSKQRLLLQAITTPNRISRIVNVRPILALEIQRNSIDMAFISGLGGHPDDSVHVMDRLEWKTSPTEITTTSSSTSSSLHRPSPRRIPDVILHELSERIQQQQENVGGLIVGWPLQRETGKLGGPCGRVLFTLESLLEQHPRTISLHRPLCLWPRTTTTATTTASTAATSASTSSSTQSPPQHLLEEDAWGRCASYGRTVPHHRHLHLASKEQYAFDETHMAKDLWQDFFQVHWPDLHRRRLQQQEQLLLHQKQQQQLLQQQEQSSSSTWRRPPCVNNLVTDWRGARNGMSSSYSTTTTDDRVHLAGVLL
jgi:hypothetical protein